ncbi:MAG: AsmA family protein, partial [Gammaproteobacteria bacterium]
MPAFKIVRRLLLVGVLLLVAAALALPLLFDPNAFKGELTKLVREKTGRELTITGPIDLSVFPWLAVEVQGVRLGNAPGFGIQPFAEAKEVKVGVRLLPLLRREVEVSSVTLEGLSLHLARNRAGVANWEDLNGGGGPPEKPATKPAAPPAAAPLAALRLGGVQVEDASIEWRDALRGVRYAVQDLDLEVGRVEPGEPFDLRLQGKVTASRPTLQGRFSLTGRMRIDATLARIEVASLALETDLSGKGLPGGKLDAELGLEATLDRAAGTLTMPRFSLAALDLRVAGNLEGKGLNANRPEFSGHLKADEFVPREVLAKLGVTLPPLRDPAVLSKADLEAGFTATPASLA